MHLLKLEFLLPLSNNLVEIFIYSHPNIISYKEAFFEDDSNSLCLIMEYADKGDLYELIKIYQKKGGMIPESKIWSIFIQTVMGLDSLHDQNIFHRDLKVFIYIYIYIVCECLPIWRWNCEIRRHERVKGS